MLKSTEAALAELEIFLKPTNAALLVDPQDPDSELVTAAGNYSSLAAALNITEFTIGDSGPVSSQEFVKSPLITIINQVLGAQGDNQTVFAMEQIANALMPGTMADLYGINQTTTTPSSPAGEPAVPFFNGVLQSPAGGFIIQDHTAIREMYPAGDNGLRTEKVLTAEKETPTKAAPTFGYIAILDPRLNYSRTSADIASTMTRAIPSLEFSKCVPFFKLSIMTPASTVNTEDDETITSDMSYGRFFEGSFTSGIQDMSGRTNVRGNLDAEFQSGSNENQKRWTGTTSIGMEAFTMPQSIIPTGQANDAWNSKNGASAYTSIDRTRPFMSINSFSVSIQGTRGASAAQRAKLDLTLHDRGRLREIKALLKPATLNQVEFTVEYGWAHPDWQMSTDNIYGKLINSMRNKATYTLSNSGYAFQEDGQVKITLDMVTKGIEAINVVDASTTGRLAPLSDAVERAYEALAVARDVAGSVLNERQLGGSGATQVISTLTLRNVGTLISSDTANSIQEWIDDARGSGSSRKLQELGTLLEQVRDAAADRSAAMIEDLELKLSVLSSKSYNDWSAFVKADLLSTTSDSSTSSGTIDLYNITKNEALPTGWQNQRGKYAPLAALLQIFVVHPLYETGLYDEVQLVTYAANTTAGAAACANLGSIPIDLQNIAGSSDTSLKKVLVNEYKRQGGQYPVNRMIDFIDKFFIEPHMSVCYGFAARNNNAAVTGNSGTNYNMETGEVTFDEISENVQSNIAKLLRKYYYDDVYEGDPFDKRPTNFTPINLRLVFDVSKSTPAEVRNRMATDAAVEGDSTIQQEKTVLRIHVLDEAATERPDIMNFLKDNTMMTAGVIIPNTPKIAAGMSLGLRQILFGNSFNLNDDRHTCEKLKQNGIFDSYVADAPLTDPTIRQNLQTRRDNMVALLGDTSKKPRELRRIKDYIAVLDSRLRPGEDSADIKAYFLKASPHRLIRFCSQAAPNIIYGEEGSVVQQISIKSGGSSTQNSMFMRRALEAGATGDNEPSRGVPMRMKPAEMSIDMLGNPNVKYRQNFFINTGTGTSIDNLYAVSKLDHSITPDAFKTSIKLVNQDAYGVFNNLISNIDEVAGAVSTLQSRMATEIQDRRDRAGAGAQGTRNRRLRDAISEMELSGDRTVWLRDEYLRLMVLACYATWLAHERLDAYIGSLYAADGVPYSEVNMSLNASDHSRSIHLRRGYGKLYHIPHTLGAHNQTMTFNHSSGVYRRTFFAGGARGPDGKWFQYKTEVGAELGIPPFSVDGAVGLATMSITSMESELRTLHNFPSVASPNAQTYNVIERGTLVAKYYIPPIQTSELGASYQVGTTSTATGLYSQLPALFHPLDARWTHQYVAAGIKEFLTLQETEIPVTGIGETGALNVKVYKYTSYRFIPYSEEEEQQMALGMYEGMMPDNLIDHPVGTPGHTKIKGIPASIIWNINRRNEEIKEIVSNSRDSVTTILRAGQYTSGERALIEAASFDATAQPELR